MFLLPENRPVDYDETELLRAMSRGSDVIREGLKDLGPVWGRVATQSAAEPVLTVVPDLEDAPITIEVAPTVAVPHLRAV